MSAHPFITTAGQYIVYLSRRVLPTGIEVLVIPVYYQNLVPDPLFPHQNALARPTWTKRLYNQLVITYV